MDKKTKGTAQQRKDRHVIGFTLTDYIHCNMPVLALLQPGSVEQTLNAQCQQWQCRTVMDAEFVHK